jgi:hypothetical protein
MREDSAMFQHLTTKRRLSIALPGLLALTGLTAPAVQAGSDAAPCRVRNVTQGTAGRSLGALVDAAHDGDLLVVRGVCTGGVTIDKALTIRGVADPATLTGRRGNRVLTVAGAAMVTIHNVAIQSGRSVRGGGILNRGTLILTNSTVRGNSAIGVDREGETIGNGGGILNLGNLVMNESVVTGNEALGFPSVAEAIGHGGGILNRGRLSLNQSTVAGNRAGDGGGIYNRPGGTMSLVDSAVRGNDAERVHDGAGIVNFGTASLRRSIVEVNFADGNTGGIANAGRMTLTRSIVRENFADIQGSGGGISNTGTLTVRHTTILRNVAAYGGGGIFNDGTLTMRDSIVRGNEGGHEPGGGGIANRGTATIRDSIVARNLSFDTGAGIYNSEGGAVTLVGTIVRYNIAVWEDEADGGGVANHGTLTLVDASVRYNTASGHGGGVFNASTGSVMIDADSVVASNVPDDCFGTSAC